MHERDLLNAAFEIVDPTARREYLDQACAGNSALRVRVERLLSRAAEAADFLEQPASDLCSDFAAGLLADASKPPLASPAPVGMNVVASAVGTLFGRYRVERELGSGGMGVVYLAEDLRLGRRVALKLPKFDADGELHLTERFRREARTMASVQHRNLCPIFDVDEQDGVHYLTMSFIDGEPLSQIIKRGRERMAVSIAPQGEPEGVSPRTIASLPVRGLTPSGSTVIGMFTTRQIAELIRKLALGLEAAHRAGVVHRDLKPSNVMIDRDGEPILMDFGLAWLVHEADARVTQTGAIIGTPAYMSPEQAEGDPDKIGTASDIYSLGVILYELITGRPIRSGSVKQVLLKLMHEIPARPSEVRSDVDPRLEEICCKAIASRPEDRFATAAEFAEALACFHAGLDETLIEPRAGKLRTRLPSQNRQARSAGTGVLPQDEITIVDSTAPGERQEPVSGTALATGFSSGNINSATPVASAIPLTASGQWRILLASLLLVGVIGAVWAMIARPGKVETANPLATVPLEPTTPTKPDVPTRQPGDGQVENLPHEIVPAKPQVPVDPGKPFVVVREGKDVRTFKTLAAAMDARQPGDVVEIRSNERLPIQWTEPVIKPLTIRAGAGYRPLLAFVGPLSSSHVEDDFSVEGCDLDFRSYSIAPVKRKPTWRFHRCRLWGEPPKLIPTMRFTECVIVSIWGIEAPNDGTSTNYEFDNCLIRNGNITGYLIRYWDIGSHTLRLRNCTIYAVAGGHSRLAIMRENAKLTVEATGNVFHCQSQATELIEPQSMSQVTWIGADNCFSGNWYQIWEGNVLKEKGLPAWNKLWKEPERDSREVDFLAFEWGRIQRLPNPERSVAVRAATEKMIAQHKLPEVGPDWNLVGPGAAYVRALAAEGRAVPESELRPERREDGPIVLLRAGKELRGYVTLTEALDAAQDKDVVELRTDGLVKGARWTGDSRLLTIRAGAGYTPTIDGDLVGAGTDRLILEGLTIRDVLQASGGFSSDFGGDQPLFPTQGSLVRMMNCTLLGERGRSGVDAWMFGNGESLPEIVNCDISFLRIGLRSGGTARLRNSVLTECRPNVESRTAPPGTLEIERCVFWLPELAANFGGNPIHSLSAIKIQAHRSIFVSPVDLTFGLPLPIEWTGAGNMFVKPFAFRQGKHPLQLEQFQTEFHTEADSIELPPWEFDPAQWRILRDKSPGYQPRPDGTDYGADIDRLVNAIQRNAPRPAIAPFNADEAKAHQAAWAKHLGVPVEHTNSIGMKFVLIPPGEFTMGGTPLEIEAHLNELDDNSQWRERVQSEAPQHKVVLTQPIYLGVHEVTQKQYETVMGTNPAHHSRTGSGRKGVAKLDTQDHPVEKVNWNNAAEFCAKLNETEKVKPFSFRIGEVVIPVTRAGYGLPTEALWEFACRAGSTTKFSSGDADADLSRVGWFARNSGARTHAVGKLPANPFGLHDLHGNVWEWVEDVWEPEYYERFSKTPAINPIASTSAYPARVIRGGCWGDSALFCRSSCRHLWEQQNSYLSLGFRVTLSVAAVKAAIVPSRAVSEQAVIAEPKPAMAPFNADEAQAHQKAWAKHLGVPVEHTNSIGMKFVLIPPGEFMMGSTPAEIDEAVQVLGESEWEDRFFPRCTKSEGPQHKVSLTKPIYLGVYEVTQAEFVTVMGMNPSDFAPTGNQRNAVAGLNTANHPVEMVSWNDAAEFCAKLSQLEKLQPFYLRADETVTPLAGTGYRLPTEAQWEFACRAGTMTKFSHDERFENLESTAWLDRNSSRRTHAVGELKANPFGLHDMHGNVWEYVEDAWEQTYYEQFQNQPAIDPRGTPANGSHILRGGHWRSTASICRASSRIASTLAIFRLQNCAGFRVTLEVAAVKAATAKRKP